MRTELTGSRPVRTAAPVSANSSVAPAAGACSSPRAGVLGGTFDPVHLGHLAIAKAAKNALALDRVLFVPARLQPHKLSREVAAPEHRWAMLLLALDGEEGLAASRAELDREGPSYTAETLLMLQESYGADVSLFFICGADALAEMETWYRPDLIFAAATVAVARRPGCDASERMPAVASRLAGMLGARIVTFDAPLLDISSTMIRHRIARGCDAAHLLPAAVYQYVLAHGLYKEGNRY